MFLETVYIYSTFALLLVAQEFSSNNAETLRKKAKYFRNIDTLPVTEFLGSVGSTKTFATLMKQLERKNEGHVTETIINELVDDVLTNFNILIPKLNRDPIEINKLRVESAFQMSIITASVALDHGKLYGTSTIRRVTNATVDYHYPILKATLILGFKQVECRYDYEVKFMEFGPTGQVIGTSTGDKFTLVLSLDTKNWQARLDEFAVNTLGNDFSLRLEGNVLIDWIADGVIYVLKPIIKPIISEVLDEYFTEVLDYLINRYNKVVSQFGGFK